MRPLVYRLHGPADVVIFACGALAWALDRTRGETWQPLADPPVATSGAVLTQSAVAALLARVGSPFTQSQGSHT